MVRPSERVMLFMLVREPAAGHALVPLPRRNGVDFAGDRGSLTPSLGRLLLVPSSMKITVTPSIMSSSLDGHYL
jgi:hypothetical protein